MKKKISIFLVVLFCLAALAGCAKENKSDSYAAPQDNGMTGEGYTDYEEGADYTATNDTVLNESPESTAEKAKESAQKREDRKKLIKTADIVIEAKDVDKIYKSILEFVKENDGYEFTQNVNSHEDSKTIQLTIKIAPENLNALVQFAGTTGELISSRVDSEDITDSYYDSALRLKSLRNQLEKYNSFLAETKNVDEMLKVQREIDSLITQIESIEGRISMWDRLVEDATVNFTITQKADPKLKRRDINWNALSFSDMGYLIKAGTVSVLNVLVSILQWIAIILIVTSPLWLLSLLILGIVFRKRIAARRKKAKEKKKSTKG